MKAELNSLSTESAKKRLVAIIDNHIKVLAGEADRDGRKVLAFNEALLEEWTDLLQRMLFIKDAKPKHTKSNNNAVKNQLQIVRNFPFPAPLPKYINRKYLLSMDDDTCDLF
jgi:hypothetical protein